MHSNRKTVLFLAPPNPFLVNERSVPRIGLLYLGAVLRAAGHEVGVHHLRSLDELRGLRNDVHFVGISSTTREYPYALQMLNYLKRRRPAPTVCIGGPHASALPDECLRNGFDIVVSGDAEDVVAELVSRGRDRNPEIVRCPPMKGLDRLPFPARELLEPANEWLPYLPGGHRHGMTTFLLLSRGCPYRCAFCGVHACYERRSADNIGAELGCLHAGGYRNIVVLDDLPFANEEHVRDFCRAVTGYRMRFRCNFRADILTARSARLLVEAGCTRIQIGIESAKKEILDRIRKRTTEDHNARAIAICHEAGLCVKAMFIWGLPGDTADTADALVGWVARHRPDSVQLSSFVPLPGSPLWEQGYSEYVTDYGAMSFFDEGGVDVMGIPNDSLSATELRTLRRTILSRLARITHVDRGTAEDAIAAPAATTGEAT